MANYEKKYMELKSSIERLYYNVTPVWQSVIESYIPELKESDDKRIKNNIIIALKSQGEELIDFYETHNTSERELVDWIEKQGNISPTEDELEALRIAAYEPTKNWNEKLQSLYEKLACCEQSEQKVETKFKVGDWVVTDKNDIVQIKAINNGYYTIDNGMDFNMPYVDRYWHKWTIQDSKDGDVLHKVGFSSDCIFIFNSIEDGRATAYCCIDVSADKIEFGIQGPDNIELNNITPATKIQSDLLFIKMKEAGYEWDVEKLELRRIEQKHIWSEEDESYLNTTIAYLKDAKEFKKTAENCINWLKSLKERVQPQPQQEWGEEDENRFRNLIYLVEHSDDGKGTKEGFVKFINRLKSFRPQNKWKPSDEQMEALRRAAFEPTKNWSEKLQSLYTDLKKLRGE